MRLSPHDRAEVLAGAITLGEATDEERIEYRRHVAACAPCLQSLGGERELERLNSVVQEAHASEIWEPDVRGPLMDRLNLTPRRVARYGVGILGICLVVSLIGHFVVGSSFAHPWPTTFADPLVINYEGNKIVLERRSVRDQKSPAPVAAPPKMLVEHNIVHLAAPAGSALRARAVTKYHSVAMVPQAAAQESFDQSQAPATRSESTSNVPPWESALKKHAPSFTGPAPSVAKARAESLTIAATYSMREATPEGGDTAINPQPPSIAVQEGAEGTTAFEVMIDEQGNPTKCVITKPAGYVVLDEAVCKAAMSVKYRPKSINGRPVPGVYRDAFTFRGANPQM